MRLQAFEESREVQKRGLQRMRMGFAPVSRRLDDDLGSYDHSSVGPYDVGKVCGFDLTHSFYNIKPHVAFED